MRQTDEVAIIELNARFGGGFPLSREAGADFPRWMLEELTGRPSTARADGWRAGLVMLRYDAAVFVQDETAHELSPCRRGATVRSGSPI